MAMLNVGGQDNIICINQSTIHSNKEMHADSTDPAQIALHLAMHEYV